VFRRRRSWYWFCSCACGQLVFHAACADSTADRASPCAAADHASQPAAAESWVPIENPPRLRRTSSDRSVPRSFRRRIYRPLSSGSRTRSGPALARRAGECRRVPGQCSGSPEITILPRPVRRPVFFATDSFGKEVADRRFAKRSKQSAPSMAKLDIREHPQSRRQIARGQGNSS